MTTAIYIDGFNLYYGIAKPLNCRWVDIQKFFEDHYQSDDVQKIYFFESLITGPHQTNQEIYLQALATRPKIEYVNGEMKEKIRQCKLRTCSHPGDRSWRDFEEKHTDVNIALQLLADAVDCKFEKQVLVTADTDLLPALRMVRSRYPKQYMALCVPAMHKSRINGVRPMMKYLNRATRVNANLFVQSQFPSSFKHNGFIHARPLNWRAAPLSAASDWVRANPEAWLPELPNWYK